MIILRNLFRYTQFHIVLQKRQQSVFLISFYNFGFSLKLYSDRDPAFEVELFQISMELFG